MAVPYELPIVGYNNHFVDTLRIWDAEAVNDFQLDQFDKGDYHKAVEQENLAKTICEVLYPNDNHYAGKELRLKQQYFFVSASVPLKTAATAGTTAMTAGASAMMTGARQATTSTTWATAPAPPAAGAAMTATAGASATTTGAGRATTCTTWRSLSTMTAA